MIDEYLLADEFLNNLKSKPEYKEYVSLSKIIDVKYIDVMKELKELKLKYDDVLEYGIYHPSFKSVSKEYSVKKNEVFSIMEIKRYLELNSLIEEEVNDFFRKVTSGISANIPVFNKFGFMTKKSKGGSCGVSR